MTETGVSLQTGNQPFRTEMRTAQIKIQENFHNEF